MLPDCLETSALTTDIQSILKEVIIDSSLEGGHELSPPVGAKVLGGILIIMAFLTKYK